MLPIRFQNDDRDSAWLETPLKGQELLNTPLLNKACAFSSQEREALGLLGLLPDAVESIEEQVQREYEQYSAFETPLEKNVYLNALQDRNEILYYRLVCEHIAEMLPILYTPEVGEAVRRYSHAYRRPRGLYISYPHREKMQQILSERRCDSVDITVVTDASAILGIGDQGVGGMGIPIAKLALDSLCGAVHPARTLPILLDVGTDNQELLADPLYMGWRHERLSGADYETFIEQFVTTIKEMMPDIFLHWEDFARDQAEQNLNRYREVLCSFNDDIQGTGVVCMSALVAALKVLDQPLSAQRIVVFGFGAAGQGNAAQIVQALMREGLKDDEARQRIWAIDRNGLLVDGLAGMSERQQPYARPTEEVGKWQKDSNGGIPLAEVLRQVKPTILIGCSTVHGSFTEEMIRGLAAAVERPIIFPLSNPTDKVEATPADLLRWTEGKALIATGSPFDPVALNGRSIPIAQCNNAFVFPGIALGVISSKATQVTDGMLWTAVQALSELSPALHDPNQGLLPTVDGIRDVCAVVGRAVAAQAFEEGVARITRPDYVQGYVTTRIWQPAYLPLKPSA